MRFILARAFAARPSSIPSVECSGPSARAIVIFGFVALASGQASGATASAPAIWTLDAAVKQALSVAPELREASADVTAHEAALRQAGAWPNPSVAVRADQKLGVEDNSGGTDLTHFSITQPVPLTRLGVQKDQARASLAAAQERFRQAQLEREAETAAALHTLQLAQARLSLASQRVAFVNGLEPGSGSRSDRIVRYLTPLERARLAILREDAEQEAASVEGTYSEAAAHLRVLLGLAPEVVPRVAELSPMALPAPLGDMLGGLDLHPALGAGAREVDAARAGIAVARAQRFADPSIGIFRERDLLGGQRRDYSGVILNVEVPLWSRQAGAVQRAAAEADQAQERRNALRRDLEAQVRQSHLHLNHLIEQAKRYSEHLLVPARTVLDLGRRSFLTGEQNVLGLVDAHDTYFNAQLRYLELLEQSWQEAAQLRLAAGVFLTKGEIP